MLAGLTEPGVGGGDTPVPGGETGALGAGTPGADGKVGSVTGGRGVTGRSGVGKAVGIDETPVRTAEIDERSAELVSVGRGGNPSVGSPVGTETAPVGREEGLGRPEIGGPETDGSGSGGNAVAWPPGAAAPGIDVRTTGVGMAGPVGSEPPGIVAKEGLTGGRTGGGKGRAGEAAAWKTYAPSDIRTSCSIVLCKNFGY